MQLSEKQLKVQQRADKTLNFGCLIKHIDRICKIVEVHSHTYLCVSDMDIYGDEDEGAWYNDYRIKGLELGEANLDEDYYGDIGEIIGHPMTRGRLCYLCMKYVKDNSIANTYSALIYYTEIHIETLHKTILERPEEFIDLVIAFLETLPKE